MDAYFETLCAHTFTDAARALFKKSPRMKKVRGGMEFLYIAVPFSADKWCTEEGIRMNTPEVALKLLARAWFDLNKPPGAPQLPLHPDDIEAYIEAADQLWQRTGYFARALAKTGYRVGCRSAREAVRDLMTPVR
jgi:hypothetical protein